jgi:hypothetical protein
MFHRVLEIVKQLSSYWYHLKSDWMIPCTGCLLDSPKREFDSTQEYYVDRKSIAMFSQSEFLQLQSSGIVELRCSKSDHVNRFHMEWIFPDLGLLKDQSRLLNIEELRDRQLISTGLSGCVYSAHYGDNRVAVKQFAHSQQGLDPRVFHEFCSEVRLLHELSHPCIIKCFGFSLDPDLLLVMEFCEFGDLHHFLSKHSPLTWKMRLRLMINVASAIDYLHAHSPPIIHRDLKSPNILVRFF